jgi:hypothetical protein
MPNAGLAASDLEPVAISGGAVSAFEGPAILNRDRNLLRDKVVSVIGVVP